MNKKNWQPSDFQKVTKGELYGDGRVEKRGRWLRKTLGILFVFWLLSKAITPWTGLYEWERAFPEFGLKIAHNNIQNTNAWILGSSTIMHHVDPTRLDSITAHHQLKWYNFGLQRAVPPESFFLAHLLLDNIDSGDLDVLVFEVQPEENLSWDEVSSLRNSSQLSVLETLRRIRRLPWKAPNTLVKNLEQARILTWGWIQHIISFLRPAQHLTKRVIPPDFTKSKGYVELKPSDSESGRLAGSRSQWMQATDSLIQHQIFIAKDFDYRKTLSDPTINWDCQGRVSPILDQMQILFSKCQSKEIRCLFHFQNLWDSNGCIYFSALEKWGSDHVFESMGYSGNEELYDPDDRYDENHLMDSGTKKFTHSFGNKLNLIFNKPPQGEE